MRTGALVSLTASLRRAGYVTLPLTLLILSITYVTVQASETAFEGSLSASGTDWRTHAFSSSSGEVITGVLDWTDLDADLNLTLFDPGGLVVATSKRDRPETISFVATSTGTWRFGVKVVSGASGYRITVQVDSAPPATDGRFIDLAPAAGLAAATETWSGNPIDFDGDGHQDVWIGYHDQGGKLWRSSGEGTMTWVARTAWPKRLRDADGNWRRIDRHTCAWGDVDLNGLVDAYCAVGRTGYNNVKYAVADNELWLQTQPGTFADAGTELGVGDPYGRGRSAVMFDATNNGRLDIYVTNEKPRRYDSAGAAYGQNKLFVNVPDSNSPYGFRFDRAPERGLDRHLGFGQEALAFDHDDDGLQDLLVTGRGRLFLFQNLGDHFVDITAAAGIPGDHVMDVVRADIDADGVDDLVEVRATALVWQRDLGTTFGPRIVIRNLTHGWAAAAGDADGDSRVDIYVQQSAAKFNPDDFLLLNGGQSWLTITAPPMAGRGSDVQPLALRGSGEPVDFLVLNGDRNVAGPVMVLRLALS